MTGTPEPLSSQGSQLLAAGMADEAVDVLRRAVASGEPSGPDLLAQAYLDSGDWHAAVDWLAPLVARGQVRLQNLYPRD
jgi:hypothetical protein